MLAWWEGKKAEGAVRGKKDEVWAVAFDVTWRSADLDSGSDPFQVKFFLGSQRVKRRIYTRGISDTENSLDSFQEPNISGNGQNRTIIRSVVFRQTFPMKPEKNALPKCNSF